MTMGDTSTVGEVHVRAWQAAYRGVMPDEYLNGLKPEDRQLIRHATGELSRLGFATAVLWVEASNDRARRSYKVEGWQFDGTERTDTVEGAAVDEVRFGRELGD
jgi:hypothetical protein